MGRLDALVQSLNERSRKASAPAAFIEEATEPKEIETDSPYLKEMMSLMSVEIIGPEEVKDGFISVAAGLVEIDKEVSQLAQSVANLGNVPAKIDQLRDGLNKLVQAIRGIKIPETIIPEAKDVDLTPLKSSVDDLRIMVAMLNKDEPETVKAPPTPENWKFKVNRNNSGLIRDVEVTNG